MLKPIVTLVVGCAASVLALQAADTPLRPTNQPGTRPPDHNDESLRALYPEEIAPNLNFYALDPLYDPEAELGWAETRIEEKLDRGVVATVTENGDVYVGWRLLREDPANVAFNVYRITAGGNPVKINRQPVRRTTDLVDSSADLSRANAWFVRALVGGREQSPSARVELPANAMAQAYRAIQVRDDVAGISMIGIGDLDGDGHYDFVVKHPGGGKDPGRVGPQRGAYKWDGYNGKTGEFMWRIDLGWNVDMGIWWTPMVVRDLDGDNVAEICVRGSSYAATEAEMLPSGREGFLLDAPEYLIVYDGKTGKEVDRAPWIELGSVQEWGDNTGNRASRHLMGVAYLDGKTPSVLAIRGTYGMMRIDAWTLKNKKLQKVWRWTNERAPFKFQGQGAHGLHVADIDGDGMDEILNGTIAIDQDGRTIWGTGNGHGDRFYITDIDPRRDGLEILYIHEDPMPRDGLGLHDARTGHLIWGYDERTKDNQLGGALVADIDPSHPGMELWASAGDSLFFSAAGEVISDDVPSTSFAAWWDADLLRELMAGGGRRDSGPRGIVKWQPGETSGPILTAIEGNVQQVADIYGDWREEVITYVRNQDAAQGDIGTTEIRIYSTTIPAADRRVSLMQDPLYRHDVTVRTMGYPHIPQTSFYLGLPVK